MSTAVGAASLPMIVAYARAGALDYAWTQFVSSGLDKMEDSPAALSVKGRLLKDLAQRADGPDRHRLVLLAADAYAAAADLQEDVYPLINAATLSLLGRQPSRSQALSEAVLERIENGTDRSETPYYREATRAEALLLIGREPEARTALARAIDLMPRAWEDHASTLRQFALILAEQGKDAAWLDPLRPPRSMHFAGHMAVAAEGTGHDKVRAEVEALLEREKVGFGYGALAAGADLIVAEALIARGAELHVLLPGGADSFRAHSVEPFGEAWPSRFKAALDQAETVQAIPPLDAPLTVLAIGLANEIAMGAALMNAKRLATEAIQLLVVDSAGSMPADAGGTKQAAAVWDRNGHRRLLVTAARERSEIAGSTEAGDEPAPVLAAALAVELPGAGLKDDAAAAAIEEALRRLREALADAPVEIAAPQLWRDQLIVACASTTDAATLVERIRAAWPAGAPPRIGADYGICHAVDDPFGTARRLHGRTPDLASEAMRSTPPGSVCVTEAFAAALEASGAAARSEFVGELAGPANEPPTGLYSLGLRASVR